MKTAKAYLARTIRAYRSIAATLACFVAGRSPKLPGRVYLLGTLTRTAVRRYPHTSGLARLERSQLVSLVECDSATRAIVLQQGFDALDVRQLLHAVTHPNLRSGAARALTLHRDDSGRSRLLYEVIVLCGPEVTLDQRASALLAIARTADRLSTAHARSILTRCLPIAAQPVIPYEPPGLGFLAKAAAVALLEEHPELDPVVTARQSAPHPSDLEILATALVRRPIGRATAVGALLQTWRPSAEDAIDFAQLADSRRLTKEPTSATPGPLRGLHIMSRTRTAVRIGAAPALVALVTVLTWTAMAQSTC